MASSRWRQPAECTRPNEPEHRPHIIVDHALGDGDSSELCRRLNGRGVPFITYSGNPHLMGVCSSAERLEKPVNPDVLLTAFQKLLEARVISR